MPTIPIVAAVAPPPIVAAVVPPIAPSPVIPSPVVPATVVPSAIVTTIAAIVVPIVPPVVLVPHTGIGRPCGTDRRQTSVALNRPDQADHPCDGGNVPPLVSLFSAVIMPIPRAASHRSGWQHRRTGHGDDRQKRRELLHQPFKRRTHRDVTRYFCPSSRKFGS